MTDRGLPEPLTLDERVLLSLSELCRSCGLAAEDVARMVEEGLLHPRGKPPRWRFPATDLRRAHAAQRLQRDLGLNLAGAALALDLLDEMERMRARMRVLERLLGG